MDAGIRSGDTSDTLLHAVVLRHSATVEPLTDTAHNSAAVSSDEGVRRSLYVSMTCWRAQPFRVRLSWRKCQHPCRRHTQDAIRDRSWPRPEYVLLTSKAHDDESDASRESDLGDVLGRRSDRDGRFDACWRAHLGHELLDLLLAQSVHGSACPAVVEGVQALDRSDHVNEQQRNANVRARDAAVRTSVNHPSLKSTGAKTRPTSILDASVFGGVCSGGGATSTGSVLWRRIFSVVDPSSLLR